MLITYFASGSFRRGRRVDFPEWRDFYSALANAKPAKTRDKLALMSWSPTLYTGNVRSLDNSITCAACVLDFDNKDAKTKQPLPVERRTSPEQALAIWPSAQAFVYTSWSHSEQLDKFRLVLPYPRPLPISEHERVRQYVWAQHERAGHVLDQQCRDVSHIWFVGNNGICYRTIWQEGPPLDVDGILAEMPEEEPEPPPPQARPLVTGEHAVARATREVQRWTPDVSSDGSMDLLRVCLRLVRGYALDDATALHIIQNHYLTKIQKRWTTAQIERRLHDARTRYTRIAMGSALERQVVRPPPPPRTP